MIISSGGNSGSQATSLIIRALALGELRLRDWWRVARALALALAAQPCGAQQYITDDAGITAYRACQIQMWHGERSSWVLPVCTPLRNVELSLGFIAVWDDDANGHFEYTSQVKTLFRPLRPSSWGAGAVIGTGRDPAFSGTGERTSTWYAYVPLSLSIASDRIVLHQNTGLLRVSSADTSRSAVTWAMRADVRLRRGFVAVAEAYGSERIGGAGGESPAEFQAGVRKWLRANHVQLDLSYGGTVRGERRGAGWTLGLALITPPFL